MKYWPPFLFLIAFLTAGCGKPGAFSGAGYHVRGGVVWYLSDWTSSAFQVTGADARTFVYPLPNSHNSQIAMDKAHVYFRGSVIPAADAATFRMMGSPYLRDAKNVFYNEHIVCDDPEHFEQISALYVKNSYAVFTLSPLSKPPADQIISKDPANFRMIQPDGPVFFADGKELIVAGTRYTDIDPKDFVYLGDSYWRAGDRGYYFTEPLPDGHVAAELESLTGQYARDGRRVYYLGRILPGADPKSFAVTDPKWPRARDAFYDYDQGTPIRREP